MTTVEFTGRLTIEKVIKGFSAWDTLAQEKELIRICLSEVGWIELNAVHRLVLFIECLKRSGCRVEIFMPFEAISLKETKAIAEILDDGAKQVIRQQAQLRKKVARFLAYLRFPEAAACPHVECGEVTIYWNHHPGDEKSGSKTKVSPFQSEPFAYERIYPLRWLRFGNTRENEIAIHDAASFITNTLSSNNTRLKEDDAQAIVGIALHEFLENVHDHAQLEQPYGLFSIWVRQTEHYRLQVLGKSSEGTAGETFSGYEKDEQAYLRAWNNPAKPARECIEFHFGDSGIGITQSLRKAFNEDINAARELPADINLNDDEKVLFYALNRWSSSGDRSYKRGTRGLYRLRRLAMGYEGMISLASPKARISWNYFDPAQPKPQKISRRKSTLPGTHLTLRLVVPESDTSSKTQQLNLREICLELIPQMRFESLKLEKGTGLSDSQKNELKDVLRWESDSLAGHLVVVLLYEIPKGNDKAVISQLLYDMALLSHPGCFALLAPVVTSMQLQIYLQAVNEEIDQRQRSKQVPQDVYDPIPVIDRDLKTHWIGGDPALRECLVRLVDAQSWQPIHAFSSILSEIRQQPWLIAIQDDQLRLRFDGPAIQKAYDAEIDKRLQHALALEAPGQPGLSRGKFVTPSLWLSELWLDTKSFFTGLAWYTERDFKTTNWRLVQERLKNENKRVRETTLTVRIHPAFPIDALVLSLIQKLKQTLGSRTVEKIKYLLCDSSEAEAVNAFEKYLSVEPIVISRIDSPGIYENVWGYLKGRSVLVFADIIHTANSAKKILHELLKAEAQPLAVATFIDDRKPEQQGEMIEDYQVPVIFLTKAMDYFKHESELKIDNPGDYDYIEPQIFSKAKGTSFETVSQEVYPVSTESLKQAILKNECLVLNHLHRPGSRHFNFYMNVDNLIDSDQGGQFIDEMSRELTRWLDQFAAVSHIKMVTFYYPEFAGSRWAQKIAKRLFEKQGSQQRFSFQIRPVLRPENRSQFVFHTQESLHGTLGVVIDWGVVTGNTITRITRFLAEQQVESILCMVALSSMQKHEERHLTSIAQVYRDEAKTGTVDVRWVTFASFPIQAYFTHDCPVCRIQNEYQTLKKGIFTPTLTDFIDDIAHNLEPKTRTRFFEKSKEELYQDNFGVQLSPEDIYEMALLRTQIEEAGFRTANRVILFQRWQKHLNEINEPQTKSVEYCSRLLCLLANTKIKLEENSFLRLQKVRKLLSDIASEFLKNEQVEKLHAIAVIVLAACSTTGFSRNLKKIILNHSAGGHLLKYTLLEVHRILQNFNTPKKAVLVELESAINEVSKTLTSSTFDPEGFLKDSLQEIRLLLLRRKNQLPINDVSQQRAIAKLKDVCAEHIQPHRPIPTAAKVLLEPHYEKAAEQCAVEDEAAVFEGNQKWAKKKDHWQRCLAFLEAEILPSTMTLFHLFESEYFRSYFNDEDIYEIRRIMNPNAPDLLQRFSRTLADFAKESPKIRSSEWLDFKRDRDWIFKTFLNYKSESQQLAKLFQAIQPMPSILKDTFENVLGKWQDRSQIDCGPMQETLRVFCHQMMLEGILDDILENAIVSHRIPEQKSRVSITIEESNPYVHITIRNWGSHPDQNNQVSHKSGLELAKSYLKAFKAELKWGPDESTKTFTVNMSIPVWSDHEPESFVL